MNQKKAYHTTKYNNNKALVPKFLESAVDL